ncbi:MAG: hypothetical protein DRN30_01850 [Thermoplasmata archaeon]|nr:MAG: hypothetical protein DRN30_01850 [Thermoplasmata archaeon]
MTDLINNLSLLEIPRGDADRGLLQLDMSLIYQAEGRISETRVANPATAAELTATFNEACNTATKYIAWIKYEILRARRNYDLAKATVIIDKLPEEAARMKEAGIKSNPDFREALISRDAECRQSKDIWDALEATKTFIEAKVKTFERSYWDAKENVKKATMASAVATSITANAGYPAPIQDNQVQTLGEPSYGSFIGKAKF